MNMLRPQLRAVSCFPRLLVVNSRSKSDAATGSSRIDLGTERAKRILFAIHAFLMRRHGF